MTTTINKQQLTEYRKLVLWYLNNEINEFGKSVKPINNKKEVVVQSMNTMLHQVNNGLVEGSEIKRTIVDLTKDVVFDVLHESFDVESSSKEEWNNYQDWTDEQLMNQQKRQWIKNGCPRKKRY